MSTEAAGGVVLLAAAVLALVAANSPWAGGYQALKAAQLGPLSLLHWVNDGLMALFLFVVGLEIKRELAMGQLASAERRRLPLAAALAGMAVPALIFAGINASHPENLDGWAIPAATDIAFALGVLALLGKRAPVSLKLFLTAVAVLDDLGAILIIALFYTDSVAWPALAAAGAGLALLVACGRFAIQSWWPTALIGVMVWAAVLQSGVHATLAGVAVALTVPTGLLARFEHALQPWVAFAVVPLFGFLNAGVNFAGMSPAALAAPLPLGIALGLLLGKPAGILSACWLMIRLGFARVPAGATWRQVHGVALLCGIGFTMSLFIGGLAFGEGSAKDDAVKLGVLAGSLLSALGGWLVLRRAPQAG